MSGILSKRKIHTKLVIGGVLFALASLVVGLYLVQNEQILRNRAAVGPVPNTITYPASGRIRIYYKYLNPSVMPVLFYLDIGGQRYTTAYSGGLSTGAMAYWDTNVNVAAGQQVTINSYLGGNIFQPSVGWVAPVNQNCGFNGFGVVSVANLIAYANSVSGGQPLVSQQCWGDYSPSPNDTSAWDFNDYFVIFSLVPGTNPTPTPTPTRSPSPTPTPTRSPTPTPTRSPSPTPTPTRSQTPSVPVWDVDRNGVVNIVDIGIIVDNYGRSRSVATTPRADVNSDGTVDIIDIGIVIDHYGT